MLIILFNYNSKRFCLHPFHLYFKLQEELIEIIYAKEINIFEKKMKFESIKADFLNYVVKAPEKKLEEKFNIYGVKTILLNGFLFLDNGYVSDEDTGKNLIYTKEKGLSIYESEESFDPFI